MSLEEYIDQKKNLYELLLNYIENENSDEEDYPKLRKCIDDQQIQTKPEDLWEFLLLISRISKNHHRSSEFIEKIDKILTYLKPNIEQTFSNQEIFRIFKKSKIILNILLTKKIIKPNQEFLDLIIAQSKKSGNDKEYALFFLSEINDYGNNATKAMFKKELSEYDLSTFKEKRQKGENDSYISTLIRGDLVEGFIQHINQHNLSLRNTTITPSIFETNSFLIGKEPTLIEYAAFFGALQIFKYLTMNEVPMAKSLWFYAIHGRNPEIIHALEEEKIEPIDNTYEDCLSESVKCHHNQIAIYIQDNLLNKTIETTNLQNNFDKNLLAYSFRNRNYAFFPETFDNKYILCYLCKYDYYQIVNLLMKQEKIDLNKTIVSYNLIIL